MDSEWPGNPPDYSKPPRGQITVAQIAAMIDHSLLRPELTLDDITLGCEIAATHEVKSVCCKPADVVHANQDARWHRRIGWHCCWFPARQQHRPRRRSSRHATR